MMRLLLGLLCLIALEVDAFPQEKNQERSTQRYVFFAPGGATSGGYTDPVMHFGVGAEGLLYKGLGVGGEIGYLYPTVSPSSGVGVASVNALYQFGTRSKLRKTIPFVTGGWSVAIRDGVVNGANIGTGLHYWIRPRLGLRLEFRDHFAAADTGSHIWQCRIGLSF